MLFAKIGHLEGNVYMRSICRIVYLEMDIMVMTRDVRAG